MPHSRIEIHKHYLQYKHCFIFGENFSWILFNSLAPGKFEWNLRHLIFRIISVIDGWGISCELVLRWMSLDHPHGKSTLVQVMAWRHQATSHYLSQCWPRSLLPYGVTRPQWVNERIQFSHHTIFNWNSLQNFINCLVLTNDDLWEWIWVSSGQEGLKCFININILSGEKEQAISSHDIDHIRLVFSCLHWQWHSTDYIFLISGNDIYKT